MEPSQTSLPEHLRRELFEGSPDGGAPRLDARTALLGALAVVVATVGVVLTTGLLPHL